MLNIAALAELRSGQIQQALAIERRIAEHLARTSGGWQIRYVNQLNLARLYRRIGDLDAAGRHYDAAFATTSGSRTESDMLYMYVCSALVAEQRGSHADAFDAWLRAAILWASSDVPEAIGSRVTGAILADTPCGDARSAIVDRAADALRKRLRANAAAAEMPELVAKLTAPNPEITPTFIHASQMVTLPDTCEVVHSRGCWALATEQHLPPAISSVSSRQLSAALCRLFEPTPAGTIVIDDQLGRDLPRTPFELISVCLRIGVRELRFGDERLRMEGSVRETLENRLLVRRASAVDHVMRTPEEVTVTFRRYRAPCRLRGLAAALVETFEDRSMTFGEFRQQVSPFSFMPVLRALETERILDLCAPDDESGLAEIIRTTAHHQRFTSRSPDVSRRRK